MPLKNAYNARQIKSLNKVREAFFTNLFVQRRETIQYVPTKGFLLPMTTTLFVFADNLFIISGHHCKSKLLFQEIVLLLHIFLIPIQ